MWLKSGEGILEEGAVGDLSAGGVTGGGEEGIMWREVEVRRGIVGAELVGGRGGGSTGT